MNAVLKYEFSCPTDTCIALRQEFGNYIRPGTFRAMAIADFESRKVTIGEASFLTYSGDRIEIPVPDDIRSQELEENDFEDVMKLHARMITHLETVSEICWPN